MPSPVVLMRNLSGVGGPLGPGGVSAVLASPTQINVAWGPVPLAQSYNIYRSVAGGGYSLVATGIPAGTLSYLESGLTPSTAYCYKVRAINAAGSSPDSSPACVTTPGSTPPPPTVPPAPTGVTATVLSSSQIRVQWAAAPGADSYLGYRSTAGGPFVLDTPFGVPGSQLSYTKGGLTDGTPYCFKVRAVNEVGESVDSTEACATTSATLVTPAPSYSHWLAPVGAYRSLAHPITPLNNPAPKAGQTAQWGWFYCLTFGFSGGNGGYIGMQTDDNGKRFVFSIWDATGAWAVAPGAVAEPFGGEGVGYHIILPYAWVAGRTYQFEVIESSTPHYWDAFVKDMTTAIRTQIGYIRVPSGWGRITSRFDNFVEWYRAPAPGCNAIPYSYVTLGRPTVNFDAGPIPATWTGDEAVSPCFTQVTGSSAARTHANGSQP